MSGTKEIDEEKEVFVRRWRLFLPSKTRKMQSPVCCAENTSLRRFDERAIIAKNGSACPQSRKYRGLEYYYARSFEQGRTKMRLEIIEEESLKESEEEFRSEPRQDF